MISQGTTLGRASTNCFWLNWMICLNQHNIIITRSRIWIPSKYTIVDHLQFIRFHKPSFTFFALFNITAISVNWMKCNIWPKISNVWIFQYNMQKVFCQIVNRNQYSYFFFGARLLEINVAQWFIRMLKLFLLRFLTINCHPSHVLSTSSIQPIIALIMIHRHIMYAVTS